MKSKEPPRRTLQEALDSVVNSLGTVVDHRFWVEEVVPQWYDNEYGSWQPERILDKHGYFKTEDEAHAYMDKHEPSTAGNFLRVRGQKCYERLERRWI